MWWPQRLLASNDDSDLEILRPSGNYKFITRLGFATKHTEFSLENIFSEQLFDDTQVEVGRNMLNLELKSNNMNFHISRNTIAIFGNIIVILGECYSHFREYYNYFWEYFSCFKEYYIYFRE